MPPKSPKHEERIQDHAERVAKDAEPSFAKQPVQQEPGKKKELTLSQRAWQKREGEYRTKIVLLENQLAARDEVIIRFQQKAKALHELFAKISNMTAECDHELSTLLREEVLVPEISHEQAGKRTDELKRGGIIR